MQTEHTTTTKCWKFRMKKVGSGMVNELYMFEFAGIDPDNGNMNFYTKDGGITQEPTEADRRFLNKSYIPVYQGGFGLDFEHKGWFATANFTYALKAYRFDNDYFFFTAPTFVKGNNLSNDLTDYWTPDNRDASFPRLQGYNFKKQDIDFLKLSGLRVYVQGENLHTWTKWRGWDAESNRGHDFGQYPTPKTYSFGVEVSF